MPGPTTEQIRQLRHRWTHSGNPRDLIVGILTKDIAERPPLSDAEVVERMWRVSEILREYEFDIFKGEESSRYKLGGNELPILDLRGIQLTESNLAKIALPFAHLEEADLLRVHLEGAYLRGAHLTGANLLEAHLEGADLTGGRLEGADLKRAHLEGANLRMAHLEGADLRAAHLEGADLSAAHLEGADLSAAHLEGANLSNVIVGKIDEFESDFQFDGDKKKRLLGRQTRFIYTEFLPQWRSFLTVKFNWQNVLELIKGIRLRDWWKFNTERWFYTRFDNVRIDDADMVQAADLRRYVNDQQYLLRFKGRHPVGYWFWKWLTGCGDNLLLLIWWSTVAVGIFAWLYATLPWTWPAWIPFHPPAFFAMNQPPLNTELFLKDFNGPGWVKWFLVSFDIFTNLGIRTAYPHSTSGAVLVFLETLAGYVSLGLFISVASNKFVRRS